MSLAEAWALFSVASAVLVVHAATFLPALSDDALISLRYVRRFLDGAGLTWTQGEAVEGYSNLLWMLLVAAGGALGFDLIATTRFLGFACSLATIAAVVWTHKRLAAPRAHTCVALAALVAAGPIAAWTVGGLETPLVAALIAWAIALTLPLVDRDEIRWRDAYAPAAMLGLACLTRPDGVLFTITIAVALIGVRWGSRDRLGGALRLAIIPVALCIAQVAFRVAYYGE